jgi:murein DD-endopeptidase MepM/ murein hydrolase activator NlpD
MSRVAELLRAYRASPVAVVALVSAGLAGCSADTHRFAENPFNNSRQEVTNSVPQAQPAPSGRIESRPLPQYQHSSAPPPQTTPAYGFNNRQPPSSGISGGGRGMASYSPPPARPIETTATTAPRSIASNTTYSAADGQTIIVGTSDTVDSIAQRYNVPAREIMRVNGLPTPRNLQPGQSLVIPRAVAGTPPAMSAPQTKPVQVAATSGGVHVVNPGETLFSIARKNNMPPAKLAKANNLTLTTQLKTGMRITVPGMKTAAATPAAAPAPQAKPVANAAPAKPGAAPVVVAEAPAAKKESANLATETKEIEKDARQDATGGLPSFRWPVRGRVIAAYGAKTSGKQNDGINVAVPEGTPVKAAEDGVVTYSGNELKGYGNLVLVRHSNGYVTAYAHASELMVKRGDTIKRGQIIAKAGQTGEVASPQLHFEIRQGSTPVDPSKFLNGT